MNAHRLQLTFVGCGDAFGSGGRFNTCFHIAGTEPHFLIDCGATSVVALKQHGIDPASVGTVLITHFHADHFGGIPFLILDAIFSKRKTPLIIAGPPGLKTKYNEFMELSFPGSSKTPLRFELQLIELTAGTSSALNDLSVMPFLVQHGPQIGTCFAFRVEARGKVLAYSADTQWTESLIDAGKEADLFICEAYFRERNVPWHLDLATLRRNLDKIRPKRLILTHMSGDMLDHMDSIDCECANDGMTVTI